MRKLERFTNAAVLASSIWSLLRAVFLGSVLLVSIVFAAIVLTFWLRIKIESRYQDVTEWRTESSRDE